ncbi:MAG: response regulator [Cyclobacteriaceae bacterium]|nr:response regulator [Cyclobacteriaceae bacterium]
MEHITTLPVYCVDDDITILKLIEHRLGLEGLKIQGTFQSGEECINSLTNKPGIILLDFKLMGLNGLDTLKQIKKKLPKLKVIILTSLEDSSLKKKCIDAGAYNFINKNIAQDETMFKSILENIKKISTERKPLVIYYLIGAIIILSIILYFMMMG